MPVCTTLVYLLVLCLSLSLQVGAAQYVHLTAEIETVRLDNTAGARQHAWEVRCVVGTNIWQMEGKFVQDTKTTWWNTGTNLIEQTVLTKDIPGSPEGTKTIRTYDSVEGNPSGPAHFEDLLRLPSARIAWLAFCSGSCLKRDGRRLFPPSDLWKEMIAAPEGFSDKTAVFEDALGLPGNVSLYLTNHPIFEYRVLRSTNMLGWQFPLEFSVVQSRSSTKWEPQFTAKGRVTGIGVGSQPEIPTGLQKPARSRFVGTNSQVPVLKVDDAHYVSSHENIHPERYKIRPTSGIVLDATGYTFKSVGAQGRPVDSVEIIHYTPVKAGTAERRYRLAVTPGTTRHELASSTLQPRTGSPPFTGFRAGEQWFVFIMIGTPNETSKVFAGWSGVIEVE